MANIAVPRVYLISRPSVDWGEVERFLEDERLPPASDSVRAGDDGAAAIAEIAGRLCYHSYGRGRKDIADFIGNLTRSRDGSVFEHINYGFAVTGVSRSLTHELVRHRAGFAYSQRSQRYVDESDLSFVLPPGVLGDAGGERFIANAVDAAESVYRELLGALDGIMLPEAFESRTDRRKAIRQAARSLLPNAAETKIVVTGNARAWRHFIEARGSRYADAEIRRLALIILRRLLDEAPLLFGDFAIERMADGGEIAVPAHSKI